jgi:hypothetical protein
MCFESRSSTIACCVRGEILTRRRETFFVRSKTTRSIRTPRAPTIRSGREERGGTSSWR